MFDEFSTSAAAWGHRDTKFFLAYQVFEVHDRMAVILKKEMLQLNLKSNDLCSLCKCTCFAFRHSPGLGDGSNSTQKKPHTSHVYGSWF